MESKYVYLMSFVSGFLFVFGLSKDPICYFGKKYREQNDAEELKKDWINIEVDMRKSFEKYNQSLNNDVQKQYGNCIKNSDIIKNPNLIRNPYGK